MTHMMLKETESKFERGTCPTEILPSASDLVSIKLSLGIRGVGPWKLIKVTLYRLYTGI